MTDIAREIRSLEAELERHPKWSRKYMLAKERLAELRRAHARRTSSPFRNVNAFEESQRDGGNGGVGDLGVGRASDWKGGW